MHRAGPVPDPLTSVFIRRDLGLILKKRSVETSPVANFSCAGFLLESIVEVRMPTLKQCEDAGEEVCGYEERSPPLILPHVRALVVARAFQGTRIPPDYDVPERHGIGAMRQRRQ